MSGGRGRLAEILGGPPGRRIISRLPRMSSKRQGSRSGGPFHQSMIPPGPPTMFACNRIRRRCQAPLRRRTHRRHRPIRIYQLAAGHRLLDGAIASVMFAATASSRPTTTDRNCETPPRTRAPLRAPPAPTLRKSEPMKQNRRPRNPDAVVHELVKQRNTTATMRPCSAGRSRPCWTRWPPSRRLDD